MNQSSNKKRGIYVHLDVETLGPVPGEHALFQIAFLAHYDDAIPKWDKPFGRDDPCFVMSASWGIKIERDFAFHARTNEFWAQHHEIMQSILENAQDEQTVYVEICKFFAALEKFGEVKAIVMSPSWFDWGHFVHFYATLSKIVETSFDISKMKVLCLKSMTNVANMCGIPVWYHPKLKHTHNALDDVKEAAWRFIWLMKSFKKLKKEYPNLASTIRSTSSTKHKQNKAKLDVTKISVSTKFMQTNKNDSN